MTYKKHTWQNSGSKRTSNASGLAFNNSTKRRVLAKQVSTRSAKPLVP